MLVYTVLKLICEPFIITMCEVKPKQRQNNIVQVREDSAEQGERELQDPSTELFLRWSSSIQLQR